jgi:hypothetical protein
MFRLSLHLSAVVAVAALVASARTDEIKADKDSPLELRLVVKETKHKLDLGGKTAEEFRKILKDARERPDAPKVAWTVEIVNSSKDEQTIYVAGDVTLLTLGLNGKGAESVPMQRHRRTREFISGKKVTLAAGKSLIIASGTTLDVQDIDRGRNTNDVRLYFTEPGEYTLTAEYRYATGASEQGPTLKAKPVKLTVEGK